MINLYGTIGYTFIKNDNRKPNYILLLADMHSQLKYCDNYEKISSWFISKLNTSNILLEEVPRDENMQLGELFTNSDHTQDLKEIFLNDKNDIHGLDIRPYLILFSWNIFDNNNNYDENYNVTLIKYLIYLENFFNFNHEQIKKFLKIVYTEEFINKYKLKIQFMIIKKKYDDYKIKYKDYLDKKMYLLYKENKIILVELNNIIDAIMEFYIICKIYLLKNDNKNIIIHTGLLHSEKILFWLTELYNYKIEKQEGVNKYDEIKNIINGCIILNNDINNKL